MTTQGDKRTGSQAAQRRALCRRLDAIGWGLFFIMIGVLWLLPDEVLPGNKGWLAAAVGVGVILLGVHGIRLLFGIRPSGGAVVVGVLALVYGVTGFYGIEIPVFAVAFILIGAGIIFFARRGIGS